MKGQFRNINNKLYTVEINKGTGDLKLADEPFIINQDSDVLFQTIKSRTATCRIYTNNKLDFLYNNTANDVLIKLIDENNIVVFAGYVTPNIYSQDWLSDGDLLEIEAVDAISTIKYFDYQKQESEFCTLLKVITNIIQKANVYDTMYVAASIDFADFYLNELYINESNFISDDDEQKLLKCDEVLAEILKYFNLTLTVHNNIIYLLDYEYIAKGFNDYFKVDVNSGTYTKTQLNDNYVITKKSHKSTDTQLSLDDTYNQITVNCNTYITKNYFCSIFKKINKEYYEQFNMQDYIHHVNYYTNSKWKQLFYDKNNLNLVYPLAINDSALKSFYGSLITKQMVYHKNQVPSKMQFDDIVMMSTTMEKKLELPLLAYTSDITNLFSNSDDDKVTYLCFSGAICQSATRTHAVVNPQLNSLNVNPTVGNVDGIPNIFKIEIKIGNKWWNDATKNWVNHRVVTSIPIGNSGNQLIDRWVQFHNNITFDMNLNKENAYAIPIRNSDNIYGKLELTIYNPISIPLTKPHFDDVYVCEFCGLKDFEVEFLKSNKKMNNPDLEDEEDEEIDIIYKNVINENYVNEFNDIELKVNTQTELENSLSSVIYHNHQYKYLDKLINVANSTNQIQEQNIIQSWYNHYSTPKNILTLTIEDKIKPYSIVTENNLNCNFVVNSISNDIYNNNITTEIIEY